jgi:type IV pilus assembly protein PilB
MVESPPSAALGQNARLGDRLIEAGVLTPTQLALALREQKRKGGLLADVLLDLGLAPPEVISGFVAHEAQAKMVAINRLQVDPRFLQLIPGDIAKRFRAMPVTREGNSLTVAFADPFNVVAIDALEQITGLHIEVATATERDILNCIERHYNPAVNIEESIDRAMEEGEEAPVALVTSDDKVVDSGEAPVIRLVDQIIARAVNERASDIHFEPEEKIMRIRMRIDGIMYQDILVPKAMQSPVCARLKIMADLDIAESRIPQDGRATVYVGRRQINLRVASLPTSWGENIVVRILDPSSQVLTLETLGFSPEDTAKFRAMAGKPYGVILVTGPTGSGKTTTLYAILSEIATLERTTFTLEDPIEYRMPIMRQTQVKEEIGLTFSRGLRALLRQDPDVMLVGETRDTETAQLMVRAALTGHLVFSTLHTNDAAGAIPRLIDMQVEPYLLPSSLLAVLAQRLVRTLCPHCKEPVRDPEAEFANLKITPPADLPLQLWYGAKCAECNHTGYRGRKGIFELMIVDERFHDPIIHRAGAPEYFRLAREAGMRTMFEDGLRKAVQGMTTMEELLRVTRLSDR